MHYFWLTIISSVYSPLQRDLFEPAVTSQRFCSSTHFLKSEAKKLSLVISEKIQIAVRKTRLKLNEQNELKKINIYSTFVSGFGCSESVSTGFSNFLRSQMATWPS